MSSLFQNSYYIGNNFNTILYGAELVLYFQTMRVLVRKVTRSRSDKFFMFFSTALLFLITIYVAVQSVFGEEMWIVNADFPGGQEAYLGTFAAVWYQTMGTTASVILNLLSDGLLIYRCLVVWPDYRVIVIPSFLYVATLALGIVELWASGAPHDNFFGGLALDLGLSYYSVSIGLNIIASSIICGRIIYLGSLLRHTPHGNSMSLYTGTVPIIVESALPYSLSGIAFLVSYGIGSGISILFLSIYVMLTCVAPQLIIMRVVNGEAWTKHSTIELSALALQTVGTTHNQQQTDAGAKGDESQFTSTGKVDPETVHIQEVV
ncbi:hypothetical protein FA95DRAFT_864469 [Auriscalpium vulgare]|uniref:Uncharacterized protein n=1 Tax=Auriscalpium vulgare TaxID=40419 RepID=A0ACB8R9H6_9AGAM|nr:hypothetical protein FA95DRAFT_864469 [Auriscalpium vulgare]